MTISEALKKAEWMTDICTGREREAINLLAAVAKVAMARGIIDGSRDYKEVRDD